MAAMVSSLQNKEIYDPIRKKWVVATPEECVRQKLLSFLVGPLGYPPSCIGIEKKLSEFPHFCKKDLPNRRLDILCFESETLRPLLLIECKGTALKEKMFAQVMGYNAFIGAPLICLANEKELLLRWKDPKQAMDADCLPNYKELSYHTRILS